METLRIEGGGVLGVGVDAVDVDRFRRVLARTPTLRRRLFTDGELADCRGRGDEAMHLGARFAAKEAVMKALGVGLFAVGFEDIEVRITSTGAPTVNLAGRADDALRSVGGDRVLVSLTHTDTLAEAFAVAIGPTSA